MRSRFHIKMLITTCLMTCVVGQTYAHHAYASKQWWNNFWVTSPEVWGQPNARVASLLQSLDGSKKRVTVVDVGAGNGRNSVFALMKLFENQEPQSKFVVHCLDYSQEALQGLRSHKLPDWLQLKTHQVEVNAMTSDDLAKADLMLLYGILEYVEDRNLNNVFKCAQDALNPGGYLVLVTLVQGEGALDIEGEIVKSADVYTQRLKKLDDILFIDYPQIHVKHDRHDLGKGYPEDHLHYVYRSVMRKSVS